MILLEWYVCYWHANTYIDYSDTKMTELTEDDIKVSTFDVDEGCFGESGRTHKQTALMIANLESQEQGEALKQQILQALQLEKAVRERIIKLQELYKLNCHTATLGLIEELQQLLGDKK